MKKINILKIFIVSFSIFSISIGSFNINVVNAQSTTAEKSAEERKNEILENYPPNLSEMQEIGFGVKTVSSNGELTEQKVRPDLHFRGEDGKEYLVFYNNYIEQLRNIVYKKFKKDISEHSIALFGDKDLLTDIANYKVEKIESNINQRILPAAVKYSIFGSHYTDKFKQASTLAISSCKLHHAHKKCGNKLDNTDTPCLAIVDRDLTEIADIDVIKEFSPIEKEFYTIMSNHISSKNKVEQLNALLEKYLLQTTPEASDINAVAFCFPLNRASHYLSNFEKDLQNKDLETLEKMYDFRKKINRLALEHRFMFEQNKAPILGIKIDRCKIIIEDEHRTMIFLDQNETKKFIATLEKMLDSKASVISGKYSFEGFTGAQLRELAEKLKPESY